MPLKFLVSFFEKLADRIYMCKKCGKESRVKVSKKPMCKYCGSQKVKPKKRSV